MTVRNFNIYILIAPFCIVLLIGYYIAVYHILPYSPIRPKRITHEDISRLYAGRSDPTAYHLRFDSMRVYASDSIILKGWFIHAKNENATATVILLHGIANCKESLLGFADTLAQLGYNCLLFDSRAHGESGGVNCTFGYYEKNDISVIMDSASKQFPAIGPFAVYGNSLGAAIALQAMEHDKRIVCGIVECPFATLREVTYDYWKQMTKLPFHFIPDQALSNTERIAQFSVDEVNPERSAKNIYCPVLVAHGDQDENISYEYGLRIFQNLKSPEKQWMLIHGAGHYNIPKMGGKKYFDAEKSFLAQHLHK